MTESDNNAYEFEQNEEMRNSSVQYDCERPKKIGACSICNYLIMGVLTIAVVVLYILHFGCGEKEETFVPSIVDAQPGTGEILYVNLDSINENYLLVKQLTEEIEGEFSQMEANFAKRESTFQQKSAQFQQNMNSGVLTERQAELAYQQLQEEYQQILLDKENATAALQGKQANSISVIYDSIQKVAEQINMGRNASFILLYQSGSPFMLHADPTKDITQQILFELNKKEKGK